MRRPVRPSIVLAVVAAVLCLTVVVVVTVSGPGAEQFPLVQNVTDRPPIVAANTRSAPLIETFNGVEMVKVPPGCFQMGSNDGYDEQPIHEVCFDQPYWIDRYEVTNNQYTRFGGVALPRRMFAGAEQPRVWIVWREAHDFCARRGARLPTEAEWEYAARGPGGLVYPWGNDFVEDYVVFSRTATGWTESVGSRPSGASWVGALDLSGNVSEWVSSIYAPYPYAVDDGREAGAGEGDNAPRVIRGGSLVNGESNLLTEPNLDFVHDNDLSMRILTASVAVDYQKLPDFSDVRVISTHWKSSARL